MIVHHDKRFVFVEVARTGTTAIARELIEQYGCASIGRKHATVREALPDHPYLKDYTLVAGKRNPLDAEVSLFFKLKNDQYGNYTNPEKWSRNGGWIADRTLEQFRWVHDNDADFAEYFARFGTAVRSTEWREDQRNAAYLSPFEDLQKGFSTLLEIAGFEQQRPLPAVNVTGGRNKDWRPNYTPEIRPRAVAVFGPMMAELGYDFPDDWAVESPPMLAKIAYFVDRFPIGRPAGMLRRAAVPNAEG